MTQQNGVIDYDLIETFVLLSTKGTTANRFNLKPPTLPRTEAAYIEAAIELSNRGNHSVAIVSAKMAIQIHAESLPSNSPQARSVETPKRQTVINTLLKVVDTASDAKEIEPSLAAHILESILFADAYFMGESLSPLLAKKWHESAQKLIARGFKPEVQEGASFAWRCRPDDLHLRIALRTYRNI